MIEVEVEADDWTAALPDVEAVVERAAVGGAGRRSRATSSSC